MVPMSSHSSKLETLSHLKIGRKAKIIEFKDDGAVCQRLLEMGITPGEDVKVIRFAPMGDPIEIEIRGYRLSLRKQEADVIVVELL